MPKEAPAPRETQDLSDVSSGNRAACGKLPRKPHHPNCGPRSSRDSTLESCVPMTPTSCPVPGRVHRPTPGTKKELGRKETGVEHREKASAGPSPHSLSPTDCWPHSGDPGLQLCPPCGTKGAELDPTADRLRSGSLSEGTCDVNPPSHPLSQPLPCVFHQLSPCDPVPISGLVLLVLSFF